MTTRPFPEQEYEDGPWNRIGPQPSGLITQDAPANGYIPIAEPGFQHMRGTMQQPNSWIGGREDIAAGLDPGPLARGVLDFFGGVGGGILDAGERFFSPGTSPFTGQNLAPYDPRFNPDSLPGQLGRGFVSGMTGDYPGGPIDHQSLSGLDQAMMFGDLVDPSGVGGDILKSTSKMIPEGTLAGLAGMWGKRPSIFSPDYWNDLVNSKPTDLTVDQIRERGAYLLHMDDLEKGITNTTPETYLAKGRGTQSSLGDDDKFVPGGTIMTTLRPGEFKPYKSIEEAIRQGISSPSMDRHPDVLLKNSDKFNRIAKELRGDLGEDTQWNTYDWFMDREDYLEMQWGFNPDFFGKGPKEVSVEFDRLAQEFKEDAQTAQNWVTKESDRIMTEELEIMERGMGPGGGSGTIPPQGTGGVLPSTQRLSKRELISQGYYKRDATGQVRYPAISQGIGELVDINGQEVARNLTPHEAADYIYNALLENPTEINFAGNRMPTELRYIGDDNHTLLFTLSDDGRGLAIREGTHGDRANQLVAKGEIEEAGGALEWAASNRGKEILRQRDEVANTWIDHFLELPYVEKFDPEAAWLK